MQPTPLTHRRQHPRVPADFEVRMKIGARQISAWAHDLSMTGLFVVGPICEIPDEVELTIPLPGLSREVVTSCRVERREERGIALSFSSIDWEDLLLVARFLAPRL